MIIMDTSIQVVKFDQYQNISQFFGATIYIQDSAIKLMIGVQ